MNISELAGSREGKGCTSSNYHKVTERWRQEFLEWDHEAVCRKLGITDYDEDSIRLSYFGILHSVDRKTGKICCPGKPE